MKFVIVLIALFALATAQHCRECEQVVQLVEEFTHENSSETFVIGHLGHICNLFPAERAAKCHTAVAANKDALYKAIIAKTKPVQVCTVMTLCPDSKVEEKIDLQAVRAAVHQRARARVNNGDPTECFLCTSIFQYAEGYISSNATEEQVEQFLTKVVCPLLGPLQSECLLLVQQYPQIIQYLIQQESPEVACTELTLCPSPKAKAAKKVEKVEKKVEATDPVGCSLCTYIVAALEDYIADNATEAQLQQIIQNQICPTLPSEFQAQCQTFAKELPQYIADLEKNEPPTKACTDAGICPAPINAKKSPRLRVNH